MYKLLNWNDVNLRLGNKTTGNNVYEKFTSFQVESELILVLNFQNAIVWKHKRSYRQHNNVGLVSSILLSKYTCQSYNLVTGAIIYWISDFLSEV